MEPEEPKRPRRRITSSDDPERSVAPDEFQEMVADLGLRVAILRGVRVDRDLRVLLHPADLDQTLAEAQPDKAESAELLGLIRRQSEHMRELIDDLMDVSRITTDKLVLRVSCIERSSHSDLTKRSTRRSPSRYSAATGMDLPDRMPVTVAWVWSVNAVRSLRDSCSAGPSPKTFGRASTRAEMAA